MHSKYMVIDDDEVELGSFNYTKAAEEQNAENVLVVRHSPALAGAYRANWQRLWDESEDVRARY
jgi:phosphatidylserine/phosphatidylglycerophosphate/cardiolipin synthase-like enzyme